MLPDGVFVRDPESGALEFARVAAPTREDLARLVVQLRQRIQRLLGRSGLLPEEMDEGVLRRCRLSLPGWNSLTKHVVRSLAHTAANLSVDREKVFLLAEQEMVKSLDRGKDPSVNDWIKIWKAATGRTDMPDPQSWLRCLWSPPTST